MNIILERLAPRAEAFYSSLRDMGTYGRSLTGGRVTASEFAQGVTASSRCFLLAGDVIREFNSFTVNAGQRSEEISAAMAPFAIETILRRGDYATDEMRLFRQIYSLTNPGAFDFGPLAGFLPMLELISTKDSFPPMMTYFDCSPSHVKEARLIQNKIDDMRREVQGLQQAEGNTDSQIVVKEQQIETKQKELAALFNEIDDVSVDDPRINGSLDIRAVLRREIVSGYSNFLVRLYLNLNSGFGLAASAKPDDTQTFIPTIRNDGIAGSYPVYLERPGEFVTEEGFPDILSSVYLMRQALWQMNDNLGLLEFSPSHDRNVFDRYISQSLGPLPFLNPLAQAVFPGTEDILFNLVTQPARGNPKGSVSGRNEYETVFPYCDPTVNLPQLRFAISRYFAAAGEVRNARQTLLGVSPAFSKELLPFMANVSVRVGAQEFNAAGELIERFITSPHETLAASGGLLFMELLAATDAAKRLKNRIRSIRELRQVLNPVYDSQLQSVLAPIVPRIVGRLSVTLDDYYGNKPHIDRIRQAIDEIAALCRGTEEGEDTVPNDLDGDKPSEILDNGIIIYGPPGAGKTFLADCLANEYGYEVVKIAPEEMLQSRTSEAASGKSGRPVDAMIRKLEEKIDGACEQSLKRPVIIFWDEFEENAVDRESETITADQLALVNYSLRKVEYVRQNYPNVILISATNKDVRALDRAMTRDGRFDILLRFSAPTHEDIINIIVGAVNSKTDGLVMDTAQLDELANKAEGLMPASIIKAVKSTFFRAKRAGKQVTFQDLCATMERKASDRQIDIESNKTEDGEAAGE